MLDEWRAARGHLGYHADVAIPAMRLERVRLQAERPGGSRAGES